MTKYAIAVCCSVLQCVAVCCSALQCVAECFGVFWCVAVCCSVLQCVAVCYSVLQCVAVRYSVLQCVAVRVYVPNRMSAYQGMQVPRHLIDMCDTHSFTRMVLIHSLNEVTRVTLTQKIIGLFCKRALQKRQYSAKATYNFIDPTDHSHPISLDSTEFSDTLNFLTP